MTPELLRGRVLPVLNDLSSAVWHRCQRRMNPCQGFAMLIRGKANPVPISGVLRGLGGTAVGRLSQLCGGVAAMWGAKQGASRGPLGSTVAVHST